MSQREPHGAEPTDDALDRSHGPPEGPTPSTLPASSTPPDSSTPSAQPDSSTPPDSSAPPAPLTRLGGVDDGGAGGPDEGGETAGRGARASGGGGEAAGGGTDASEADRTARTARHAPVDASEAGASIGGDAGRRPWRSRIGLRWLLGPVGVLVVLSWIGDAIGPGLTPDPNDPGSGNPILLLLLSPRLRWQVAAVNYVDPWLFFLLATLRLLAADPPFYLLGRWHGEAAMEWAERKSPATGAILRDSERFYGKLVYPAVAIAPNNVFCMLAGASKMRPVTFAVLNVGGTLVRLYLVLRFGEAFEEEIASVLGWVGRHRWWLVAASTIGVLVVSTFQSRSGTGDIGQLQELGHELAADESTEREETP